eukprot:3433779-Prymnesium_polylepis.1
MSAASSPDPALCTTDSRTDRLNARSSVPLRRRQRPARRAFDLFPTVEAPWPELGAVPLFARL